jgi:hypothetical protein
MDNPETSLIIASTRQLPAFEFNVSAKESKEVALRNAALIAKVTDRDSKIIAVRAQQGLKKVISDIEKARKELKEPLLNAGRQLDNLCALETLELDKEFGRVSNAVKEFDDAERRRVMEEARLQRLELERIEAKKQAELKRIADEQAAREAEAKRIQDEADRKAREAADAAAKLVREATNKKQREAAERAAEAAAGQKAAAEAERQRQQAVMSAQRAKSEAQAAAIEEKAGDAAYCAAKPIAITTVAGSRQSTNWKITVDQPFVLARHRPDLVNITPRLAEIKAALNNGETIQGITAVRETTSGVTLPPERKAIEV